MERFVVGAHALVMVIGVALCLVNNGSDNCICIPAVFASVILASIIRHKETP